MHIKAVETSIQDLKKIGDSIRRRCASADELIKLKNALVEVTSQVNWMNERSELGTYICKSFGPEIMPFLVSLNRLRPIEVPKAVASVV